MRQQSKVCLGEAWWVQLQKLPRSEQTTAGQEDQEASLTQESGAHPREFQDAWHAPWEEQVNQKSSDYIIYETTSWWPTQFDP